MYKQHESIIQHLSSIYLFYCVVLNAADM
jgi:hypothetical protein